MTKELDLFNPTCPENAKWYACKASAANRSPFVGCCTVDPCTISGCAVGNLAAVSFNASAYGSMPEPSCPSSSSFYSCVNTPKNVTFWGCCKSDPCDIKEDPNKKACPKGDLTPAILDTPSQQAAYGASMDDANKVDDGKGESHMGVIIGGAVGGGVAIVAIIAILIFCLCKRRRSKSSRSSVSSKTNVAGDDMTDFYRKSGTTDYRHSTYSEAPISYPNSPQPAHSLFPGAPFGQHHQYAPVAQSAMELPADFVYNAKHAQSPPLQQQRYSELPADVGTLQLNPEPVEMESPVPSPRPLFSPPRSPLAPAAPAASAAGQ